MGCRPQARRHDQAAIRGTRECSDRALDAPASPTLTGLNSTPSEGATDWMTPSCPLPWDRARSRRIAARDTPGESSLSSSSHFPLMLYSKPQNLLDDAKEKIPRLKWDLSDVGLRNFLTHEEGIGIPCTKYRTASSNGWSFAPLGELREAWCRRYGPSKWITLRLGNGAKSPRGRCRSWTGNEMELVEGSGG
jgi:hypothetical protein